MSVAVAVAVPGTREQGGPVVPGSPDESVGRFGVRAGGVGILVPAARPCEYVPGVRLTPLPGATAAVAGLMQRGGWPIPVFALGSADAVADASWRADVLVVGAGRDALALIVDGEPQSLCALRPVAQACLENDGLPPDLILGRWAPSRDELRDAGSWAELDMARLAASLGGGR